MELAFSLDGLSLNQIESLLSKLPYVTPARKEYSVGTDPKMLSIRFLDPVDGDTVKARLVDLIDQERQVRAIKRRVIHQNQYVLSASGNTTTQANAKVGGATMGLAVHLSEALDNLFVSLARDYSAQLRQYPALISRDTLDKCNYARMFPQNIYLISEFPHDVDVLRQAREADHDVQHLTQLSPYALSPAVCFHSYEEMAGQTLDQPVVITAKGHCFRHEASERINRYRLNDFVLREIIYVGPPAFVEAHRNALMLASWNLFCAMGMSGRVETASDPFFSPEDVFRGLHQMISDLKYELVVDLKTTQESFATASFNIVNDTLCRAFHIRDTNGKPLHSGCVGFGIDRWVYALIEMYGDRLETWPENVRALLRLQS